jgi:HSP20 family molecular chaperone IbpA
MVMTTLFNHPFDDFLTEADLLFKNAFKSNSVFDPVLTSKINYPVDISETDRGLLFEIAVVGLEKKDISVKTEGNILRISYIKPEEEEKPIYVHKGISRRSFDLSFKVSARYDLKKIEAQMSKGLLSLEVPFSSEAEPKEVKIN